ncbi:MAG: cell envelope integrity protein TolA [Candidatus Malihini olakiniferum]
MLKATEKPGKLKRAIFVSAILHIILIFLLVWNSFDSSMDASGGGGSGSAIDVVMVDPNYVVEQHNHHQKQQSDAQRDEQVRNKQATKAKKKAEKEVKKQAAIAAVAKKQAEEEKKAEAVADIKAKANAEAKASADKQTAAEAAAQSDAVDALLRGLASSKSVPKSGGGTPASAGKAKKSSAFSTALDSYGGQVRVAIQSKFYDLQLYRGKICTLRIILAPDGLLASVKAESGDPILCQAAIAAANQAKIPRPPSTDIYEAFKNASIDFKPQ